MSKPLRKGPDIFEVESDTGTKKYLVSWGTEGPFWSCTCMAYSMDRNRKGGMGRIGRCKHVELVKTIQYGSMVKAAASLRTLEKDLEEMA